MHPILFELPWFRATSYGTLILLGVLATVPGIAWDARTRGLPRLFVADFYIVLVVGAIVGGRVAFLLASPDPAPSWDRAVALGGGGFVFYGSLGATVLGFLWLAKRYHTNVSTICDVLFTWLALGHAFGRLGCFYAGCCYGATSTTHVGVHFPEHSPAWADPAVERLASTTCALHPVQLYEASGLLVLLAIMLAFRRRGLEGPWLQSARWALGYGTLRLVTEAFRGDSVRGQLMALTCPPLAEALGLPRQHALGVSPSQVVSVVLIGLGTWGLVRRKWSGGRLSCGSEPST